MPVAVEFERIDDDFVVHRSGAALRVSFAGQRRDRGHRTDGVLEELGAQRAAPRVRGGDGRARRRGARCRATSTASPPSRWTTTPRSKSRARSAPARCASSRAIHYGGGAACGVVMQAALAVASGAAEVVVCYRAMNERSQQRFGIGTTPRAAVATTETAHFGWYTTFGLLHAGVVGRDAGAALPARLRRHDRGLRPRLGRVSPPRRDESRTRGSTASRSRSTTTRRRAGSCARCGCSTAARRATARSR